MGNVQHECQHDVVRMELVRDFIKQSIIVAKPGIIFGNLIPVLAGFFLASKGVFQYNLIYTLFGAAFVIACGCIFNNYIDRDIDALMNRTKNRPLVKNTINRFYALFLGAFFGIVGLCILYFKAGILSMSFAILGVIVYVVFYTPLKRFSIYSVYIGSVSGAMPPLIGYAAFNNNIDLGGLILFLMLLIWQIPHSFAISVFNADDYLNAKIKTCFSVKGIKYLKFATFFYIILFIFLNILLVVFGYAHFFYLFVASLINLYWAKTAFLGFSSKEDVKWARKVFFVSILSLTIISFSVIVESVTRNIF